MERKDKIFWLVFATIMLVGTGYLLYVSQPYEETIWIPQNGTIANFVNNKFVEITDVTISGTASRISYQREYQSSFGDNHNTVYIEQIVPSRMEIYYVAKMNDKTYYYKDIKIAYLGEYKISPTGNSIKINYERGDGTISVIVVLLIISLVIALKASGQYNTAKK